MSWRKYARSHPEFDLIRAQFCAWMSFRNAKSLLLQLFPLGAGCANTTLHRQLVSAAQQITETDPIEPQQPAERMILPLDTTFVRGDKGSAHRNIEIVVGAVERGSESGARRYFSAPAAMSEACVDLGKSNMKSLGWTSDTKLEALTDGGRNVQLLANRIGATNRPIAD